MTGSFFQLFSFTVCQDPPAEPPVTRKNQLEMKGDPVTGRGRGRGRGRGKPTGRGNKPNAEKKKPSKASQKVAEKTWEQDWSWDPYMDEMEDEWGWNPSGGSESAWPTGDVKGEEAQPEPATKRRRKSKEPTPSGASNKADTKAEKTEVAKGKNNDKTKKHVAKTPAEKKVTEKNADLEETKKRPRSRSAKDSSRKGKKLERLPPAPTTQKDQKLEIVKFLRLTKDLTEDNAKEQLKDLVPDYKGLGYDGTLNIYWLRKGVKGTGVGVKSVSEGKDYAHFGFLSCSDNWIIAMATSIKAAEILAPYMQTRFLR